MKFTKILLLFFCLTLFTTCVKDKGIPVAYGYPDEIGKIILSKCAGPGCHNDRSYINAGGFNLSTWQNMFKGSNNGQPVIPFRPDYSSLCYFVNTYPDLGVALLPTMPFNAAALTRDEVRTIQNWIASGAPDISGTIMYADDPKRKKIYVANQGCDVVTVFDAETFLPMRMIDVGNTAGIEGPHMLKLSPDGQYWYVIMIAGSKFQKFRTSDDVMVGEVEITLANWNTFQITSDSKTAFCVDWSANGKVFVVDLQTMTLSQTYQGSNLFTYPHGTAIAPDDSVVYVCAEKGNCIYKIDIRYPNSITAPDIQTISFENAVPPTVSSSLYNPHEVAFDPQSTNLFITCPKANEVRVLDPVNESLAAVIPTGVDPREMVFSKKKPYLFVACTDDTLSFPGKRGSVTVIDYTNFSVVKKIYTGFQPHGIALDDDGQKVYVANRNVSPGGPAPHHSGACAGRNGYVTVIDMNSLELIPKAKVEVAVDPYSVAFRK